MLSVAEAAISSGTVKVRVALESSHTAVCLVPLPSMFHCTVLVASVTLSSLLILTVAPLGTTMLLSTCTVRVLLALGTMEVCARSARVMAADSTQSPPDFV